MIVAPVPPTTPPSRATRARAFPAARNGARARATSPAAPCQLWPRTLRPSEIRTRCIRDAPEMHRPDSSHSLRGDSALTSPNLPRCPLHVAGRPRAAVPDGTHRAPGRH
jgi:hypothetical protein